MTPLEQSARALGEALGTSTEFRELVAREKAYAADAAAQALVKQAQELGARVIAIQKSGTKPDPAEVRRIAEVQTNLAACEVVNRLIAAQKAYEALAQRLNTLVQSVVEEHRKTP